MAKITEEASATVTMNMEPARKELDELKQSITKCRDKLAEMMAEPEQKRDLKGIKDLEAKLSQLETKEQKVTEKLQTFRDTLKNLNGATFNQLYKASKELESQIKRLKPGTEEYIAATHDLKMVRTRINDLREGWKAVSEETGKAKLSFGGIADAFNKYWGMFDTLTRTVSGVSMKFRQAAEDAAKLDDVYADVMKTTGLLHEEVADLDKELMKIDTRTSREQLLLLARDAGKLGISGKEDILGFVRAADQIQVALGEDLGEGAIKNLGKIADVFGLTKEMGIEKSLLSIASAVNALGQASTASEAYLVDFTQRLAGVGAMAGLSVQDILGFASGLDQSAMKVEMAATAFQKFLMSMYEEPAKFAKYAGMEVEAFSELLKTNANEAITTVMKAMNGQDGFAAIVPVFNEMGLDGARAVGVLSAMTQNLEAVTQAQALANAEFAKATSVTEEYATKNNNMQAQLEKARKEFHNASVALGQSLNPIMLKSTKATTYLIKALAQYGKEIKTVIIVIAALTVALKARNAAVAIGNAAMKVANALQATGKVITLALSVAYNTLANNTTRAAAAQKLLNSAMNASVIGVILTAVTGLTVGIMALTKRIREARKEREWLNELEKDASVEYAKQASEVMSLSKIVHNNNLSLEERKRALAELKKIVPGYHADLTEEGRLIRDNTAALDDYLDNLKKTVRMEIFKESYRELQKQMIEQEKLLEDAKQRQAEALKNAGGNTQTEYYVTEYGELGGGRTTKHKTQYGEATDMVEKAESGLKKLQAKEKEIEQQIGIVAGKSLDSIDQEIAAVNDKYKQLFNEAREMNRDNPAAANERIEQLKEEQRKEIDEIRKNHAERRTVESEETATTNAILTQTQFDYLQERQDKLNKKEKEMVAKGYAALSAEESKALKARYDKLMKADNKAADQRYQQAIKDLEQQQREEQNLINQQYFNREITAEEHERQLRDITMKYLQEKLQLARDNGKDTTQIEAAILKEQMANRKTDYAEALKQLQSCQKDEENALAMSLAAQEITEKEYQAQMLEVKTRYLQEKLQLARDSGQDETDILQAILDAQLEAQKAANEEMAKLKKEAKEVIAGLDPSAARQPELQAQLDRLDVLHNAELLSEKQYEEAVKQLRKKYADEDLKEKLANVQKYVEQVNNIMSEASNFASALKEAETAKLEAEYQAQLTVAGDNAEQREQIEAEYEQKQLDLKKKYADTEMAINIAKTIASGAVAAIKAYAEGGPYLGIALAALIAATTAAEVATIIAQRNAIKNTSTSGGASTGSPSATLVTPTGYSEGGFTGRSASDSKPVGIVHANEWVAPAPMVRRNPVLFADLEQYRKTGFPSRGRSVGFAEGGFTGNGAPAADGMTQKMLAAIERLEANTAANTAAINRLVDEGVQSFMVYDQYQSFNTQRNRFKNATSR